MWWWFHRYMHVSKPIKLYTLNMYSVLYINYTFWVRKTESLYKGLQGPTQSGPPTNSSLISDHSPAPAPLGSYYPWNVPGIPLPQGFCTCLSFCLESSSSKYPTPPSGFYWKVSCSVKFTMTTLIKFINSPPILSDPIPLILLYFPPECLSSQNILCIYLFIASLPLKSRGMWDKEFHLLLSLLCL